MEHENKLKLPYDGEIRSLVEDAWATNAGERWQWYYNIEYGMLFKLTEEQHLKSKHEYIEKGNIHLSSLNTLPNGASIREAITKIIENHKIKPVAVAEPMPNIIPVKKTKKKKESV